MNPFTLARRLCFQKLAAPGFMYEHLPSVAAAMDAYNTSRTMEQAFAAQRASQQFPALHATQPAMHAAAFGGSSQPYVQFEQGGVSIPQAGSGHHRHRHHKHADEGNLSAAVAHGPLKQVATDPAMERQRWRAGIDSAFNAHFNMDRPDGNVSPTSDVGGTINRLEG